MLHLDIMHIIDAKSVNCLLHQSLFAQVKPLKFFAWQSEVRTLDKKAKLLTRSIGNLVRSPQIKIGNLAVMLILIFLGFPNLVSMTIRFGRARGHTF